jgi:hypothetical protein
MRGPSVALRLTEKRAAYLSRPLFFCRLGLLISKIKFHTLSEDEAGPLIQMYGNLRARVGSRHARRKFSHPRIPLPIKHLLLKDGHTENISNALA